MVGLHTENGGFGIPGRRRVAAMPDTITLLDEDGAEHRLAGTLVAVDPADLAAATGWRVEPEGLCRGDVCVPLRGRAVAAADGTIDLAAWAAALRLPVAVDEETATAAVAPAAAERSAALAGGIAPDVELPSVLDGQPVAFSRFTGRKRVLLAWASW